MPQSSSYASKRIPKSSGKKPHPSATPESSIMRHLDMSSKAATHPRKAGSSRPITKTSDRKRRASSVSSVSSVSSLEEMSDEADDSEDDADDEEDRPLARVRSFARRRENARKTGHQNIKNKRRRVSDDEDSEGHMSSNASDSDESSDDIYAAVDYITDADDEDQDVEKLEEMMIMRSEKDHRALPSSEAPEHQWTSPQVLDDHMFLPAASFFDEEQLYSAMDAFGETDRASEAVETPVARRVHFEERFDSSSDSDSHTDDEIPSDFLQQDSLDPQLRRMIENDNETHRSHRRQSEEMFGDTDYGHGNIYHVESEGSSEGSLSGYESMMAVYLMFSCVSLLTQFQPTMAIRQMKTCPRPPPSPIRGPSFAGTRQTHWFPRVMTRATASRAAADLSWAPLLPTHTSPWLWLTARASTL